MARTRSQRNRGVAPRKTDWLTTLAVIVPLAAISVAMSPYFVLAAGVVLFLGVTLATIGVKRTFNAYQAKGLQDFNDAAPWYMRGGLLLLISQIYHVCKYPKVLGLWFFLEWFGVALLVTGGVILDVVKPPLYPGEKPGPWGAAAVAGQPQGPAQQAPPPPRITGDLEIDKALADVLNERDLSRRSFGANRLAELKPDAPGRDPAVRAVVADKLANLAVSNSPFGPGEAVAALEVWATPKEVPALIQCFRKGIRRDRAARALRTVGPAAEKAVLELVTDQDVGVRMDAVEILKDIGTEQSLPTLQRLAAGNDIFTKRHARDAVAAIKARTGR
jgi:hypothetical protein